MEVSHYAFVPLDGRRVDIGSPWNWHGVLDWEARTAILRQSGKLNLDTFAGMGAFKDAPMRRDLLPVRRGMMIEVDLPLDDEIRREIVRLVKPVWVAECLHMIGYYILVRWLGAEENDVFWIHGGNAHIHPIGFANRNEKAGYDLAPPEHVYSRHYGIEWIEDVITRTILRFTPSVQFELRGSEICVNKFKVSDRVEVPHDDDTFVLTPAIVTKIPFQIIRIFLTLADLELGIRSGYDSLHVLRARLCIVTRDQNGIRVERSREGECQA